jgi:hypothetical protein
VDQIDDPEAQRVLRRMAGHEQFMVDRLGALADEATVPAPAATRTAGPVRPLTVGGMIGKKQE